MIMETKWHERIVAIKAKSSVRSIEGARLSFLASNVPHKGVIVELGSHAGKSACYLAAGVKSSNKTIKIYCIDLWDLGVNTPSHHHAKDIFQQFQSNLQSLDLWENIRPIKSTTVATALGWYRSIDLLFIDAGHKYEEVCADYYAWSKFIKLGGIIAFHDYIPEQHVGIVRMIEEDLLPSNLWKPLPLCDSIWSAERII